jgi:uncharacterized cupin superfamily protein
MIVRKDPSAVIAHPGAPAGMRAHRVSDAGGLTQYGAYVVTLDPGARSSDRHWHEQEDEMILVLAGEATVLENDGPHVLGPGDAACWPAGSDNAHSVVNRSPEPCTFLVVGTRPTHDVCRYPDSRRVLHTEGDTWRLVTEDGTPIESGRVK